MSAFTTATRNPVREVVINGNKIFFEDSDVEWFQSQPSFARQIDVLFEEWHVSSRVKVKGHGLPIKLWAKVLPLVDSKAWEAYKKQYSEIRTVMTVRELYPDDESFWKDFSERNVKTDQVKRFLWSRCIKKAREIRDKINGEDAAKARAEEDFSRYYIYDKKKIRDSRCLRENEAIAHRYRERHKTLRPWDLW